MEEMMYLNGEKPGAGGGRGRGRGGPGDRGRGGLLTSPAGRGAPPPRSALLHTLKLLHRSFFVIWPSQKVVWLSGPHYNWSNSADIDIEK